MVSLLAGSSARHAEATCPPLPSLSGFVLRAFPPRGAIQLEFGLKSLRFEFISRAGPLASGL